MTGRLSQANKASKAFQLSTTTGSCSKASTSAGGRAHGPAIQRASARAVRTLAGRAVARRPT
jgi:hypothetical protein